MGQQRQMMTPRSRWLRYSSTSTGASKIKDKLRTIVAMIMNTKESIQLFMPDIVGSFEAGGRHACKAYLMKNHFSIVPVQSHL